MLAFSRAVNHILDTRAVEVAGEPLSPSRIQLLRLLQMRGAQTSTQISSFLGVTRPAVTRLVTTLVAQEMVRRVDLPEDRRGFTLELTDEGVRALEAVHLEQQHLVRSAFKQASDADPTQWAEMLEEMASALAHAEDTFQEFCQRCGGFSDGSCVLTGGTGTCLFLESEKQD
jgi:DNA-binding MarR family transcriptional regulator